jgi:cellulose synthase/poly-beta-1,6-N-acetylglucosamine synthase-like glycosyltransferase
MQPALTLAGWIIAAPLLLVFSVLLLELVLGARRLRAEPSISEGAPPSTAILMPAHDEAVGIAPVVQDAVGQLWPGARLVVIADNCSDETASVARLNGSEVIERSDSTLRGKGYALAFGRDALQADPPDVVIILDADCYADAGSLARLAHEAHTRQRPVQGLYLLRAGEDASPKVEISNFAFLVKNLIRQRASRRLGTPAILGGTGMAFPWSLYSRLNLASSELVEDLVMGIDCLRAGHPPRYEETARIWSEAASEADTVKQRARWEQGFMATALRHGLPLVLSGLGDFRQLWMGLHLLVPPLALLIPAGVAGVVTLTLLGVLGGSAVPAVALGGLIAITIGMILLVWALEGRVVMPARTLVSIPLYILWKAGIYGRFFARKGEKEWVRTRRSG